MSGLSESTNSLSPSARKDTATAIEVVMKKMAIDGVLKQRAFLVLEHPAGATAAHLTAKEADFLSRKLRKAANDLSAAEARGQ